MEKSNSTNLTNRVPLPEYYVRFIKQSEILKEANKGKNVLFTGGRRSGVALAMSTIKYLLELLSERDEKIEEIKTIAEKTLNMVDYKTYFKRDNKSIKQEGFKALQTILNVINNKEKRLNNGHEIN